MTTTVRYLSFNEVADRLGLNHGTLTRYALPDPDVVIGRTRGWTPERIDAWAATRPGKPTGRTPNAPGHRHAYAPNPAGGFVCECGAARLTKP